jgi:hypothetical protein
MTAKIFLTSSSVVTISDMVCSQICRGGKSGRFCGRVDFFRKCLLKSSALALDEDMIS